MTTSTNNKRQILDKDLLKQQKKDLKRYIVKGKTGNDKFKVLAYEASMGKSRETDQVLKLNSKIKIVYVKKFNDESFVSLKNILDIDYNLSSLIEKNLDEKKVIVVNSANSFRYENNPEKVKNAQIVILSHKKYQLICKRKDLIKLYFEGRNSLIIDEYMSPEIYCLNQDFFQKKSKLWENENPDNPEETTRFGLAKKIENMFLSFINKIAEDKEKISNNIRLINSIDDIANSTTEQKFLVDLKNAVNELQQKYDENKLMWIKNNKSFEYQEFFDCINSFLNQQFIYYFDFKKKKSSIHTLNKFDYIKTENNLILDATGNVLHEYKLNDKLFEVLEQEPIYFYGHSKCHVYRSKSYQSNVNKDYHENFWNSREVFLTSIAEHIEKNHNNKRDKVFIVLFKDYEIDFQKIMSKKNLKCKYSINHFKNIVGRNDWRDFNVIYLPIQFNEPDYTYLLYYSWATAKDLTKEDFHIGYDNDGNRIFVNSDIEKVRIGQQIAQMYQTLKRINRNNKQNAHFYLIMDDDRIFSWIPKLFKNILIDNDFDINLYELKTDAKRKRIEKWNKIKKMIGLLKTNPSGPASLKSNWIKVLGCRSDKLKEKILKVNDLKNIIDIEKSFPGRGQSRNVDRIYLKLQFE